MRLLILSDCRLPTQQGGGHGLGRVAWQLADGLRARGHNVHLGASPRSIAPDGVEMMTHLSERDRAEELARLLTSGAAIWHAVVDLSHNHDLSRILPGAPVVNYMMDLECGFPPPNALVGNEWIGAKYPGSRIAPLGVDVKAIPFNATGGDRLLFAAKLCFEKGTDLAIDAAKLAGLELDIYGTPYGATIPQAKPEIADVAEFYRVLGDARAFLAPYRLDSGSRVVLESAAAGTPVVVLDWGGTHTHVEDGVSGYVCSTVAEMAEAIGVIDQIDRRGAREWVRENHSVPVMVNAVETAVKMVLDGECW